MENDEFISPNTGKFICGVVIAVLSFAGFMAFKSTSDELELKKQASIERMYVACLDRLAKPENELYAAQLTACKTGTIND